MSDTLMNKELAAFKEKATELAIYLQNGIKLTGKVIEFDDQTLKITSRTPSAPMLIERSCVATVQQHIASEEVARRPR